MNMKQFNHRMNIPGNIRIDNLGETSTVLWRIPSTGQVVSEGTPNAKAYRRFWAMISTPNKDSFGTMVSRNAAIVAFMEWLGEGGGNVRFMHEMEPVGRIFQDDYEIQDAGIYAGFSIPIEEKEVIRKIDNGLVRFVSLGFNIDYEAENAIEIMTDGTVVFNRIKIVEISIGDFGSTPGTQIVEERTAQTEDLLTKIHHMVTAMFKRNTTGATPEPSKLIQEDEMTPEQIKALQDTLEAGFTRMTEKLGAQQQVQEPPPAAPKTDDLEKRISDAVEAAVKPLNDQIADLKRLTTTTDPMTATLADVESDIVKVEAAIEELKKQEPNPNRRLSFVRNAGTGKSLTIEDLLQKGDE